MHFYNGNDSGRHSYRKHWKLPSTCLLGTEARVTYTIVKHSSTKLYFQTVMVLFWNGLLLPYIIHFKRTQLSMHDSTSP